MAVQWSCVGCGVQRLVSPSRQSRSRCRPCLFANQKGKGNSNWRDAGKHRCLLCGVEFQNYNKTSVYCSQRCYHLTRPYIIPRCPKPPKAVRPTYCPKPPRPSRTENRVCLQCGKGFHAYRSQTQKFCGYECHLASGGARRAGLAAAQAIMKKYGAKKDANHGDVVTALKEYGVSVIDTSAMGGGFPDLICGYAGVTMLMEIKNPKTSYGRRGLNKNQIRWQQEWTGGPYSVVDSVEAAIRAVEALKAPQ